MISQSMFDCDAPAHPGLELKIADSVDELEACFRILHDAYVAAGFMRPHLEDKLNSQCSVGKQLSTDNR